MRSVTRIAGIAALALAGCGNYSTEDLRFLVALPTREDLRVAVPAAGTGGALSHCANGESEVWRWAKPTSDGLNRGVDFVVSLVDAVRRHPPTWREADARGWGPFDDANHPGRQIQVLIARSYPDGPDAPPRHDYAFQARVAGTPSFTTILGGTFHGASSARGRGNAILFFDAIWTLGMNDGPEAPRGEMRIDYDRASDPVTIGLSLTRGGFGAESFGYGYAGWPDGSGAFDYAFRNAPGDRLEVGASYDAAGAGRAAATFTAAAGGQGSFRQCWDAGACLVYLDDPSGFSCGGSLPCSVGAPGDCPATPVSPF